MTVKMNTDRLNSPICPWCYAPIKLDKITGLKDVKACPECQRLFVIEVETLFSTERIDN